MKDFDGFMDKLQTDWRANNIEVTEHGTQNNVQKPWLLPSSHWEEGLWEPLRSEGQWPVSEYLKANKVSRHTGAHNLKSSWMSGVNLYYPAGQTEGGRVLLASFLCEHVDKRVISVDSVEFEYAEEGDLSPATLRGEEGGSRGSGQTSPDIAVFVNNHAGLLLIENKLTEHSFYPCSGRSTKSSESRPANPDASRCENPAALIVDLFEECHLQTWGRKYWNLLGDSADKKRISELSCCPAARAGYQLLRQQALAEGIAKSGNYDFVVSCVALDDRNDILRGCLQNTGIPDIDDWGQLFDGAVTFRTFSHQDWVAWVRVHDRDSTWAEWSEWVASRYAL